MRIYRDYVIVKLDCLFEEEHEFKGANGKKIIMMVAENPEQHIRNYGEVISVPKKLSKSKVFSMNAMGPPLYFNMNPNEIVWLNEVPITVEVGDKVYLHHQAILQTLKDPSLIVDEKKNGDKTTYYLKVLYNMIFCSVRDKKIIPNATWTLVRPDMESWTDIIKPIPEIDQATGQPKMKAVKKWNDTTQIMDTVMEPVMLPEDKWIQTKIAPEHKLLMGFIDHIGLPLKDKPLDLKKGDHVLYRRNADFAVKIEGEKYFLIKQRHIEAILES